MNSLVKEIKENPIIIDNVIEYEQSEHIKNIILENLLWRLSPSTSPLREKKRYNEVDLDNNLKEAQQMVAHVIDCCEGGGSHLAPENGNWEPYILLPLYMGLLSRGLVINRNWMFRVKINYQPKQDISFKNKWNFPHVDVLDEESNHITALYYPFDSDGDTTLFKNNYKHLYNNKKEKLEPFLTVPPKQGRIIFFWGKTIHAGTHPVENDYRVCINYNFRLPEDYSIDKDKLYPSFT
mgnify:FL=1|jgi:hypothetical protein|tara:strand:+ start:2179 stop:2889 length:711 start_codon:yes stop_codon:yes gene_type:complete